MTTPPHRLGAAYLSETELDDAERVAYLPRDETDLRWLARRIVLPLIHEVRLHRLEDHVPAEARRP